MYEQFYVLKNGAKLGPFSRTTLQTDWAIGLYDGSESVITKDGDFPLKQVLDQGTAKTEEEKKIESMMTDLPVPNLPPITEPNPISPAPAIPVDAAPSTTPAPTIATPHKPLPRPTGVSLPPPTVPSPIKIPVATAMAENGLIPDDDDSSDDVSAEYIHAQKMVYACALAVIPFVGMLPAWWVWKRFKVLAEGYDPEDTTPIGQMILSGKKISFYGLAFSVLSAFLFIVSWGSWATLFKLPVIVGLTVVAHGWVLTKIGGFMLDQEYRLLTGIVMSLRIVALLVILTGVDSLSSMVFGAVVGHFVGMITSLVFLAGSCMIVMASSDVFRIPHTNGGKMILIALMAGMSLGIIFRLFASII